MYRRGPADIYVVSYNPHLLCAAQAHVNTTVVSGPRAIPYVLKYLAKGDSKARVALTAARELRARNPAAPPPDISKVYEMYRTVSFSEAVARTFEAPVVMRWPAVKSIHVWPPRPIVLSMVRSSATCLQPPSFLYTLTCFRCTTAVLHAGHCT